MNNQYHVAALRAAVQQRRPPAPDISPILGRLAKLRHDNQQLHTAGALFADALVNMRRDALPDNDEGGNAAVVKELQELREGQQELADTGAEIEEMLAIGRTALPCFFRRHLVDGVDGDLPMAMEFYRDCVEQARGTVDTLQKLTALYEERELARGTLHRLDAEDPASQVVEPLLAHDHQHGHVAAARAARLALQRRDARLDEARPRRLEPLEGLLAQEDLREAHLHLLRFDEAAAAHLAQLGRLPSLHQQALAMHRAALPAGYCEPSPAELIEEQVRLAEAEAEEAEAEALYNEDDLLEELDELERLGEEHNRGQQAEEDDLRELEQQMQWGERLGEEHNRGRQAEEDDLRELEQRMQWGTR